MAALLNLLLKLLVKNWTIAELEDLFIRIGYYLDLEKLLELEDFFQSNKKHSRTAF